MLQPASQPLVKEYSIDPKWAPDGRFEIGAERQLTSFASDFDIRDFDISQICRKVVLERVQERSDVGAAGPSATVTRL
jgi:hypothetical protein